MLYTVKETAELTGVTIKTLHHYHKVGLLQPCNISDAGYRLYGIKELERLQQILFYRELDFSLKDIKKALEDEPSRLECLIKQQEQLWSRRQKIDRLINTLKESIKSTRKGEIMDMSTMFKGLNKEEWEDAILEQREYLKDEYEYDILEDKDIEIQGMNEMAAEAQAFMKNIADALTAGWKATDKRLQKLLKDHIKFLNEHGVEIDSKILAAQSKFFLEDDFHRNMLESQQIGLSYYLCIVAEAYAAVVPK